MKKPIHLSTLLAKSNRFWFSVYAIIASFSTYSCMYAFRKPFAVGTFENLEFFGIDYKILLITSQVVGYMVSKFIGIKLVSEISGKKRAFSILFLIAIAETGLLLFAIIPPPYNIPALFLNGLPLGMIWGLVFSYLEGRRMTEALGAGLSISFILSSGFVKSVGKYLMINWGISEIWMPFLTGALFVLPLLFFVWMLDQIPPPDKKDEELRTRRMPMFRKERLRMFKSFAPGIILLVIIYAFLTAMRDYRDNFMAEIWIDLGHGDNAMIFTVTEIPVAFFVLIIVGLLFLIRNNFMALMINHFIILTGIILTGLAVMFFRQFSMDGIWMIILTGLGLYLGYVPFNAVLFDRLIATYRSIGTAGFLIYVADSFGYLSSVGVLIFKNYTNEEIVPLDFFTDIAYSMAVICTLLVLCSILYFHYKYRKHNRSVISSA